jgi:diguanylate cyclase (GGDEF)-like protein
MRLTVIGAKRLHAGVVTMVIAKIVSDLEQRGKAFWIMVSLALTMGIGLLDYVTWQEISLGLFYLIPVSLVTWFVNRRFGIAISAMCAVVWLGTDTLSGLSYSPTVAYYWNASVRLASLLVVTLLLSALRDTLTQERTLSRTDYLTGAVSRRYFYDLLQMELERLSRYTRPFTLIYVDLDNFKKVNDGFGHAVGDELLRTVVDTVRKRLRTIDVIARLGGDEFAILLPETGRREAEVVVSDMHHLLLDAMRGNEWLITFSIGALTCVTVPGTVDDIVRMADQLMYGVKNGGKNGILHSSYGA